MLLSEKRGLVSIAVPRPEPKELSEDANETAKKNAEKAYEKTVAE